MLIAGAGGHALDVLDALASIGDLPEHLYFYDDTDSKTVLVHNRYPIIKSIEEAKRSLSSSNDFYIGVGDPLSRYALYQKMKSAGGALKSLKSNSAWISPHVFNIQDCDIFQFSIIGAKVNFGLGVLINARTNVHHEVTVGEFTEISPSATILGKATIGSFCQIGSGSIILPKRKIGSNVIVGAGTVVTKDIPDNSVVVGVPGKKIKELAPLNFTSFH